MSRHAIRSTLAGLTLALSAGVVAAPALAATQEGPAAGHMKEQGRHHHKKMMRDGVWLPGVGPLSKAQIESLKLDAKQQGLVDQARQAQRDVHKSRRDAGATGRDALKAQLDSGSWIRARCWPNRTSGTSSSAPRPPRYATNGWRSGIA